MTLPYLDAWLFSLLTVWKAPTDCLGQLLLETPPLHLWLLTGSGPFRCREAGSKQIQSPHAKLFLNVTSSPVTAENPRSNHDQLGFNPVSPPYALMS